MSNYVKAQTIRIKNCPIPWCTFAAKMSYILALDSEPGTLTVHLPLASKESVARIKRAALDGST
jgi:hypothetical protein